MYFMNKLFIILFSLAFIFGQFARVEFGNGIALIAIDIVVGLFSLFWLFKTFVTHKKVSSPLVLPALIFFGIGIQSLILNLTWLEIPQLLVSSMYLFRFMSYVGLYFFVREFSQNDRRWLVRSMLVCISVTVSIGMFQYFYYPSLRNLFYLGWDDHLYRLFSVFLDPNFTGALFVCFFLYLLLFLPRFSSFSIIKKAGFFVLLFTTTVSIFLTYSRTAYLMLIMGGILYLLLIGRKKMVFLFGIGVMVMLLLTVDTSIEGLNPFRIVSTAARLNSYQIATDIFLNHPVLGVGFNTYRYAQNIYGYRTTGSWQTSHADAGTDNSFVFVLVTTGIIGFVSYLFLWYRILEMVIVKVKKRSYFAKITVSTLLSLFVGSMFLNVLFYPFIMAWFFILISLTENTSQ